MNGFEPTSRIRIRARIKNWDGDLANPTTLQCTVHEPDGTNTTFVWNTDTELVRESTGEFYIDWDADQSGLHKYRWQAGGTIVAAFGGSFNIRQSRF